MHKKVHDLSDFTETLEKFSDTEWRNKAFNIYPESGLRSYQVIIALKYMKI